MNSARKGINFKIDFIIAESVNISQKEERRKTYIRFIKASLMCIFKKLYAWFLFPVDKIVRQGWLYSIFSTEPINNI